MYPKDFKLIEGYLKEEYADDLVNKLMPLALTKYQALCKENEGDPKEVKLHTEKNIFICMSLYWGMLKLGIKQDEAVNFLDKSWSRKAEKSAKSMSSMLKLFGLYKLYPMMFKSVAKKQFGEKAGFKAKFYDEPKSRCKFDMTTCLFKNYCEKYQCLELLKCFCHTDDANNEGLHPRLKWNRHKYMGQGDDYCDFDIYVTEKDIR